MTEVNHLKTKPKAQEAKSLLNRILLQVQPIMKTHKLHIESLSEFYPKNASLLGININRRHIKIRLRHARDESSFLDYESLLGTMLHELTHNVHSNHSKEFYDQLDKYTRELEDVIMRNGFVELSEEVKAFSGTGYRLSGRGGMGVVSVEVQRKQTLKAAISRRGYTLGGSGSSSSGGSSVEARRKAVEAALRRRRESDEKWCGMRPENAIVILDDDERPPATKEKSVVIID